MISEETRKESYDSLDKENRYNLILEALDIPKTAKEIAIELYKNKKIMDKERNATAPRLTELLKKRKSKSDRKKKTCEYSEKSVSVYEKIREEKIEKVVEKRIINNYTFYRDRSKIEKHTKYKENRNKWEQKAKEKEYLYYICDYCKDKIKILDKKYEMTGGIVVLPRTLTKRENITLVLCNKCLKPVLDEFENIKI